MKTNPKVSLSSFHLLERTSPSTPPLADIEKEIHEVLSGVRLPAEKLRGRRIAVSVGSRGIASLPEIVRGICGWLRAQGAQAFVFPAMGSHGGATGEGQRKVLADYGIAPETVGAEVRSSMETVFLGPTAEGFRVYMDRNAFESDGVIVMNRVKPHTDFTGKIESGLLKMMAVGMGKIDGAREVHHWGWKFGFEKVLRAMSAVTLGTGKILAGLAVVENEAHQICAARAALPEGIVAQEESALAIARPLVPRIPFPDLHLLIVDRLGKNISGAGMDTRVIGRGVELQPGEAPEIRLIYVRDITPESSGNAVGVGFADLIHERLFRKIDFEKMYINIRTSLNPEAARLPMYSASDEDALHLALGHLGTPAADEQRIVWIQDTLQLSRIAVSSRLADEATKLSGWRVSPEGSEPGFDAAGDLTSMFESDRPAA